MKKVVTPSGIEMIYGDITVDNVGPSLNDKKWRAQLRQAVTSAYPKIRSNNNLFPKEEFEGGAEAAEYTEQRVAWIDVPVGTKIETVISRLKATPEACLFRVLSLRPVLSEAQLRSMETGLNKKTLQEYEAAVVVDKNGQPVLYKGTHSFYRSVFFSTEAVEDIDHRPEELKAIISDEIQMSAPAKEAVKA